MRAVADRISPSASWAFDATDPAAVPQCRRSARTALEAWGLDSEVVDDAALIVSELATNVYRHVGRSPAMIALTWCPPLLCVWVHDRSPVLPHALPEPREGVSGWDWTGWGLALVESIANRYGGSLSAARNPDGRGKSVGVLLPVRETEEIEIGIK